MKRKQQHPARAPQPASPKKTAAPAVRLSLRVLGGVLAVAPWLGLPAAWSPEATGEFKGLAAAAGLTACLGLMLREARLGESKSGGESVEWKAWLREPFRVGALLALAGMLLSALFSPVPGLGLYSITQNILFIGFAVSLSVWRVTEAEARWLLLCLLATMGAEALLALGQFLAPGVVRAVAPFFASAQPGRAGIIGTLENPEYLAGWLAAGLAAAVVLLWHGARAAGRGEKRQQALNVLPWLAGGVGALAFSVIFLGGGRGALLSAAGALALAGVVAWHGRRKEKENGDGTKALPEALDENGRPARQAAPRESGVKPPHSKVWWGVGAAGVLLALLVTVWLVQRPEVRRGGLPARLAEMADLHSPSMRHRLGLLAVTSNIIMDHPLLGVGPGRYGWAFSETQARLAREEKGIGYWALGEVLTGTYTGEAHCDPLQWWAEYGLLGMLGLTLMIGRALQCGMRNAECGIKGTGARSQESGGRMRNDAATGSALWAALAALAINMWVAFPLQRPVRALTFWVLLGLVAGMAGRCTNGETENH